VVVTSANFLIDAESSMGSTMGNSGDSAQAPAPAAAATGHDGH
jgi:hypothetical protein